MANISLSMKVMGEYTNQVAVKLRFTNNDKIDYFVSSYHFLLNGTIIGPAVFNIIKGASKINCDMTTTEPTPEELEEMNHPIQFKGGESIETEVSVSDCCCDFNNALPGLYTLQFASTIFLWKDKDKKDSGGDVFLGERVEFELPGSVVSIIVSEGDSQ